MSSLSGKQGPRYRHIAGDTEPYETIGVEKLTPIIGAEISGVDIGKLVSDDARSNRQMDEIHRALAENLVIFFRDQHITPHQHLAFGRKFGELHVHPAAPNEGDPALMKIYADKDSPRANGEGWHTRRVLRPRAADGLDPLHQAMPAARRRHAVRQHVCRL